MSCNFKTASLCVVSLLICSCVLSAASDGHICTIINYQDKPVFSQTADIDAAMLYGSLGIGQDSAVSFTGEGGDALPASLVEVDGKKFVRVYFSLKPFERLDLKVAAADEWIGAPVYSNSDISGGTASLSNGIIRIDYNRTPELKNNWDMSLGGETMMLKGVEYLCFFDGDPLRGRTPRETALQLGLSDSYNGRITDMTASTDNGQAVLKVVKGFDGIAKDIELVETFTLRSGEPVLKYDLNYTNKGTESVYLGFIFWEGCIKGKFGAALAGDKLLSCPWVFGREQNVDKYNQIIVRFGPGWAEPRSWTSVETAAGYGLGLTTTKELTENHYLGASIWVFGYEDFQFDFTENTSGYYPIEIAPGKTTDMGLCLSLTQAGMDAAAQVNKVFERVRTDSIAGGGRIDFDSPFAVLYDGSPVVMAMAVSLPDAIKEGLFAVQSGRFTKTDAGLRIESADKGAKCVWPLRIDTAKEYVLSAEVSELKNADVLIGMRSVPDGVYTPAIAAAEAGSFVVNIPQDVTAGENFLLELEVVGENASVVVNSLSFEKRVPRAPVLTSPFDRQRITDLASFFRWKSVADAAEYELHISKSESFTSPRVQMIKFKGNLPHYMPPQPLTTGKWYWRVRAKAMDGRAGEWSQSRSFTVNDDHMAKELIRPITPQMPLFSLEAWRVRDLEYFKDTIPADLKPYCAVAVNYTGDYMLHGKDFEEYFAPTKKYDIPILLETNSPMGINDQFPSLAEVEWLFQNYPNVIGAYGGENMQGITSNLPYVRNLLQLCAKYGRLFMQGDGNYSAVKLHEICSDAQAMNLIKKYSKYITLAQKNNIWNLQYATQSSMMGMWLAGIVGNTGSWEDGGWYWEQVGMRRLGEWYGRRSGELEYMPPTFWVLTWIHGMNSGCAVLFAEGQPGSTIDCYSPNPFKETPKAIWDNKGNTTEVFTRYVAPFLRAVATHQLVPTKDEVLENVKLAVLQDKLHEKEVYTTEDFYAHYTALYSNTYGFEDSAAWVYEYFPNTGRYYYIPLLPYGTGALKRADGSEVAQVKMSDMTTDTAVKKAFDAAYKKRYEGDALVTQVGDKVFIINTNENKDITQSYKMDNPGGSKLLSMAGRIGPHAYVIAKSENGGKTFWLQANTPYIERDTQLSFVCDEKPKVKATPESAMKEMKWNAKSGTLDITLSHTDGAAELTIDTE